MAPPPPSPVQLTAFHVSLVLHSQAQVTMPPIVVPISVIDDTLAGMDRLEQHFRHMRVSNGVTSWDDVDSALATRLIPDFKMLDIERYTSKGYPRIHLRLYSIIMSAHRFDEAQILMLFPMSLSGVA